MRKIIRLNDPTSHGGKVVSVGATRFTVGGLAVARLGPATGTRIIAKMNTQTMTWST